MKKKRVLIWWFCGLAAIIALIWPALPLAEGPDRLTGLPLSGPGFQSRRIDLTEADRRFLGGARGVQHLIQLNDGGRIMLTVIDGSGNRHAVHDPTYCLSGGGWKVARLHPVVLHSGEANWMNLTKDDKSMEALWFFDDGEGQFTSALSYLVKTSARRATLGRSGPEPLLVTLRGLPGETPDWKRVRRILLPALGFR